MGRGSIKRRLASGQLEVVHRGVYKLGGPRLSLPGRWRAATLIADDAVLSYRSAGAFWQMRNSWNEPIEVTLPRQARPRKGLILHHEQLVEDEVTIEDGIPVTTPARTLIDLASVLSPFEVERCLHESEAKDHRSRTPIPALLQRHHRRRGSPALRAALESLSGGVSITKSKLERRFLAFVLQRGLPRPQLNVWLHLGDRHIQVDALWLPQRVIAEVDTFATHGQSTTFESDRARDRSLQVLGFQVIRITDRALHEDPDGVERDLRSLLFP